MTRTIAFLLLAGTIAGAASRAQDEKSTAPYLLPTCVVSGKKLGSMGDPIVLTHEGQQIKLCCKGCVKRFNAKPADYVKKMNEKLIRSQIPHYPMTTCAVSGKKLDAMAGPLDYLHRGRLVRFCCR